MTWDKAKAMLDALKLLGESVTFPATVYLSSGKIFTGRISSEIRGDGILRVDTWGDAGYPVQVDIDAIVAIERVR